MLCKLSYFCSDIQELNFRTEMFDSTDKATFKETIELNTTAHSGPTTYYLNDGTSPIALIIGQRKLNHSQGEDEDDPPENPDPAYVPLLVGLFDLVMYAKCNFASSNPLHTCRIRKCQDFCT